MTQVPFFVCGSIAESLISWDKFSDFILDSCPATTRGQAYRLKVGVPVHSVEGDDEVRGVLLQLKPSDLLMNLLGEFCSYNPQNEAKSPFLKKEIDVLVDGERQKAWSFVLNPAKRTADVQLIEGSNWEDVLQKQPPLVTQLSDRQKAYVCRLGSSTGREIVPIDLTLYRELMNLELIVDKGRRLALTKLGKEVYRRLA